MLSVASAGMPGERFPMRLCAVAVGLVLATAACAGAADAGAVPDLAAACRRIDALVEAAASGHGVVLNPRADDATFLRRVSLDLIGRIPSPAEAAAFLADTSADRRRTLIAGLLRSEGHVSREFEFWADLLRVESSLMRRYAGEPYIDWLKQAIRSNRHYREFVTDLVTAQGAAFAEGNGATGYYLRDLAMPQDNMSNTVQVFLGTRLACAQCHDHPFDRWTRLDYFRMAAFTNGITEKPDDELLKPIKALASPEQLKDPLIGDALRRVSETLALQVRGSGKGVVNLPKDYQYPNGKPGQKIDAHAIFGDVTVEPGSDPCVVYARWLTADSNPRFALVIANRLWKRFMGVGLIEPVDNLVDASTASDPALADALVELMRSLDYDLRAFEEVLCNTATYQRTIAAVEAVPGEPFYYPGPLLRRLSAEQIWDSLLTLVIPDVDERRLYDPGRTYAGYEELRGKSPEELWALVQQLADQERHRRELDQQVKDLETASGGKDQAKGLPEMQELRAKQKALSDALIHLKFELHDKPVPEDDPRWKGFARELVRASELPSPAPPGHLLRDFGQSDRNLIDNANVNASVLQALTLANGFVDQEILQPRSELVKQVTAQASPEDRIRAAFLAVLTREPTEAELGRTTARLAAAGRDAPAGKAKAPAKPGLDPALGDVLWALVNSDEFFFYR